jgi:hypothetical protein
LQSRLLGLVASVAAERIIQAVYAARKFCLQRAVVWNEVARSAPKPATSMHGRPIHARGESLRYGGRPHATAGEILKVAGFGQALST